MKRSRFLKSRSSLPSGKPESGTPAGDVCRQLGIAEQTFPTPGKEIRTSACERTPPTAAGGRGEWLQTPGRLTSRSTNTCCQALEKKV